MLLKFLRCLEEGAEEFFLKPVRLADVNKLKPHMMKTKNRDCQKAEQEVSSKEKIASLEVESSEQSQSEDGNNSKRKAPEVEEELSQDRTRRRYNGLPVI